MNLIVEIMTSVCLKSIRVRLRLMICFNINLQILDNSKISLSLYQLRESFISMLLRNEIVIFEMRFYKMCKITQ
jgi:hypothetical protein